MRDLKGRGVRLLFVIHHFATPLWFNAIGGWENLTQTKAAFINYVDQIIEHFGEYVDYWNTFNEPNVMISNG